MQGTRTASERTILSPGEQRELFVAMMQCMPLEVSSEEAQRVIGNKRRMKAWLALGLKHDLRLVDLEEVKLFLRRQVQNIPRFSDKIRAKLVADGWQIVTVPQGMTLASLQDDGLMQHHFNPHQLNCFGLPTRAREVAWRPTSPIIREILLKSPFDQKMEVDKFSKSMTLAYGEGVKAEIPTAEEVVWCLSGLKGDWIDWILSIRTSNTDDKGFYLRVVFFRGNLPEVVSEKEKTISTSVIFAFLVPHSDDL